MPNRITPLFNPNVNIIAAIPLTVTNGGPDASGFDIKGEPYLVIFVPFWYPWTYLAMGFWPQEFYESNFGAESRLFEENIFD